MLVAGSLPSAASQSPVSPEHRLILTGTNWSPLTGVGDKTWYYGATFQGGQNPGSPSPMIQNIAKPSFCNKLDSSCTIRDRVSARGYSKLCDGTEVFSACVRSLEFSTDGENWTEASFVKTWDSTSNNNSFSWFKQHLSKNPQLGNVIQLSTNQGWGENRNWKAPASGKGPLLFRAPGFFNKSGSEEYLVNIQYSATIAPTERNTDFSDFHMAIFPVVTKEFPGAHPAVELLTKFPDGRVGFGGTGTGVGEDFISHDQIAYSTRFPDDVKVRLVVDVPKKMSSWFHSRLSRPKIDLEPQSASLNTLTITGAPAEIPITNTFVPGLDPRYKDIVEKYEPPYWLEHHRQEAQAGRGGGVSGGIWETNSGINYFRDWSPYLDEKAKGTAQTWLVSAMPGDRLGRNRCTNDTSKVHGLINTNAMVYQSDIPEFRNGFLEYEVAGVHLSQSGQLNLGEYDLQIRSSTARCIYGFGQAPLYASVEVVSRGGTKQIGTTLVSEKAGWLRLAAYGFTFSEKKMRVKVSNQPSLELTKFKGETLELTPLQHSQVTSVIQSLRSSSSLSCIGYFTSTKNRLTALSQAQSVCDYAESLNGNLNTKASVKKTNSTRLIGVVSLRGKNFG